MIGQTIGAYRVVGKLGAGGMGEVWRASDASLGRDVAIKVLPEAFAQDPERLARFEREARTLARLNHPNIATVHGLEQDSTARPALVMELVEGPTLAERLSSGPIPVDEALSIARQIAQALEAAHEQGIVHRDLKPANIKVRPDGTVKVLDFGLAKAVEPAGATTSGEALSATVTSPAMLTAAGVFLGTAAYMSPEQARGRPVDKRTDIWAFGAVLYEMLTGRRAFPGDDVADVVASVMARDPDWARLPPGFPAVRASVVQCLQKDPRQRMRDIGDVQLALGGAFDQPAAVAQPPRPPAWRRALPIAAAAAIAAVATALVAWTLWPVAGVRSVTQFEYVVPDDRRLASTQRPVVALSPDGRYFAYQATDGVYVRAMDALEARRLPGTEAVVGDPNFFYNPFISPDGRWIGHFAGNQLRKISVDGGPAVAICPATTPSGAIWTDDRRILFGQPSGIMRVSENGGTPELLIRAAEGEELYGPQPLPGGDLVLFSITTDRSQTRWERGQVVVQSLSSGKRTVVVERGSDARYLPTGHLVYIVGDTLFGMPFDPAQTTSRGGAVPLVQGVQRSVGVIATASNYGVSDSGTLVYLTTTEAPRSFVWVRRSGAVEPLAAIPPGGHEEPRLSPDNRLVLVTRDRDIWIYELASGRSRRLTHDSSSQMGVWDPKGLQVAYSSAKSGNLEAWVTPADGTGQPRQLTQLGGQVHVDSWSPDGRLLSIHQHRGSEPVDIFTLPMDRPGAAPQVFIKGDFSVEGADFSPGVHHAAYLSQETGRREVFIRPYPGPGAQQVVSMSGGREPAWAQNGEVFYRSLDGNRMFAVTIKTGPPLEIGAPVSLFEGQYYVAPTGSPRRQYDVAADGQRVLMLTPGDTGSGRSRIIVIQNWLEELARSVSRASPAVRQ